MLLHGAPQRVLGVLGQPVHLGENYDLRGRVVKIVLGNSYTQHLKFSLPFCVKLVSTSDILDQFLNNIYVKAMMRLSYFLPT